MAFLFIQNKKPLTDLDVAYKYLLKTKNLELNKNSKTNATSTTS